MTFSEITKGAIDEAFANPRSINLDLVNAQQARRVIDRLVGYKLSPLVSSKIRRGLSAGRVQSVAVRLVVDREREIEAFVPEEYWTLARRAAPRRQRGDSFAAELTRIDGEKAASAPKRRRGSTRRRCAAPRFTVSKVTRSQQKKSAPPAVHHQHAAAGGVAQAELRRAAHHERGPVAVRGHRAGRRARSA